MAEKVIIIGSGPAGLTAAIYAARANLQPLLFEGFQAGGIPGGQLMTTTIVENFPGFPDGIDGPVLMQALRQQAANHGTRMLQDDIVDVQFKTRPITITAGNGETHSALSCIVATGATARRLPLDSERRLWGKGISACAVCDGGLPVFRNKELAVIGGGDSAVEEALHLTNFGSKFYLIHRRDQLRASKAMQERALKHPKISLLWNKTVQEFIGEKVLGALKLLDTKTAEVSELPVAGAFEAIGHLPNTAFLKGQLETNEIGYIKTRAPTTCTSVAGVFAAGDVQDSRYRQAISAAGSGCMAAIDAERWLQENGLA
jgi:thioredoxin reductase (NADPH)